MCQNQEAASALLNEGAKLDASRAAWRVGRDESSIIRHLVRSESPLLTEIYPALSRDQAITQGKDRGLTAGQVLLLERLRKFKEDKNPLPLNALLESKIFQEAGGYLLKELVPDHPSTFPEWRGLTFGQVFYLMTDVPQRLREGYEMLVVSEPDPFLLPFDEILSTPYFSECSLDRALYFSLAKWK